MKNLKKLIALIAVLALTLSTVALGATYTDVAEDSAYSVAVESLSKLGIVTGYEDGTYGPEKAVTRAEMAALIARIQGYDETSKAQTATVFADVPASHWASGYVAAASNMGIVNGYGDGTFGPEDSVKYEQAVTMIMRTLGYEPFAAANGGYPTGYLAAAQRYGVTKNVSNAVSGTDANRGTIAQLLYNGIDTPIMAQSKWGTDGDIEYTIYDGVTYDYKTLMSENLGVVKIKGVVEHIGVAGINAGPAIDLTKDPEVLINVEDDYDTINKDWVDNFGTGSQYFLVGKSDIQTMLGNRVIFYAIYDDVAEKFEIISAAKDTATNDTVSFSIDKFDSIDTTEKEIKYYKNSTDRTTTDLSYKDEDEAKFVLNNMTSNVTEVNSKLADKTLSGVVTLIDNDNKKGYDVVFVEIGASAVVDEVVGNKVLFKDAITLVGGGSLAKIDIDEDADDEVRKFYKDGAEISIADLKEWDVLTVVAFNSTAKYIVAEVIGTPVTGAVTSKKTSDTSDGGYAFKIEGNFYDVAKNAYKVAGLEIGDAGIFYVDKYGKIVAFDEDATVAGGNAGNYAYVIEAGMDTAFNTKYAQVRLLTANGVDIYDVADEIDFNEVEVDMDTEAQIDTYIADVSENGGSTGIKDTLIKYTTNSSGEIDAIWTVGGPAADPEFELVDTAVYNTDKFDADNFELGSVVDEDAVVFVLAKDGGSIVKEESFVGTLADLEDGQSYGADLYRDSKGDDANIIVITNGYGAAAVGTASNVAVINEVSTATNKETGEDIYVLSYFINGELFENVATSNTIYKNNDKLSEGDIVKVKLSSAGVVTSLQYYVNFKDAIRSKADGLVKVETSPSTDPTDGNNDDEAWTFGYAASYTSATKTVKIEGQSWRLSTDGANVYVIDAAVKSGKINVGAAAEFEYDKYLNANYEKYADYVFARKYKGAVKDIVIVKNVKEYDSDVTDAIDDKLADIDEAEAAIDVVADVVATYVADDDTKTVAEVIAAIDAAIAVQQGIIDGGATGDALADAEEAKAAAQADKAAFNDAVELSGKQTTDTAAAVDAALDTIIDDANDDIAEL